MKRMLMLGFLILLVGVSFVSAEEILIKGRLVDQITGESIEGARVFSAYEFSPSEVITDSNGNFEFTITTDFIIKEGGEKGMKDVGGNWNFVKDCYGYAQFSITKDREIWENGELKQTMELALEKIRFDKDSIASSVSEESILDIGDLTMYPMSSVVIETDVAFYEADIKYKTKYLDGDGGGAGNYNYGTDFSILYALPVDYEVYISFVDENSNEEAQSSLYLVPEDAECKTISLDFNSKKEKEKGSRWRVKTEGIPMMFIIIPLVVLVLIVALVIILVVRKKKNVVSDVTVQSNV